jgi:hypothetical protein
MDVDSNTPNKNLNKTCVSQHGNVTHPNIPGCVTCGGFIVIDHRLGNNEVVCTACGLVQLSPIASPTSPQLLRKVYERKFYFAERLSRWNCVEPGIDDLSWFIIEDEALGNPEKYKNITRRCTRNDIKKILKSIKIHPIHRYRLRSRKYKRNLMTPSRFYNKFYEKWRSIGWKLTGIQPDIPKVKLVQLINLLFMKIQPIFEQLRHHKECDMRYQCDKYFGCKHNFLNYDFVIRKLLQIAEIKYGWNGCYDRYKNDFPITSESIRNNKLRPFFKRIANQLNLPCPNNEE